MQQTGLTTSEVHERQKLGLVNSVRSQKGLAYGSIIVRNLATWFNALIVPAAIALFQLGEYRGAIAVSGMMVVNTLIGMTQEIIAKARLDRLTLVAATHVRVIRDGEILSISADSVVQNDVLQLNVGELIVADGSVLESQFLEVDEALLTGEADPVPRHPGERLLAGSFCVAGEGLYRADQVGANSTAQKIAKQARQHRYAAGPIQEAIDRVVRLLSYAAIALSAMYLVRYWLVRFPETELAQMVAATITSMVPQGLVLTATLALTLGAIRLTRRGAVVQRLDAVEAMAAVDVLCLDKTGTLTTNSLQLEQLTILDAALTDQTVRRRLQQFASSAVDQTNKVLAALRTAVGTITVDKLDELPFKAQNRFSAVQIQDGENKPTLVLGAYEALLKHLDPSARSALDTTLKKQLPTGLRLLLFAESKETGAVDSWIHAHTLHPLALIGLRDEVRPEAVAALTRLSAQGIAFKILSGDHPQTVRATIASLDLALGQADVVSGEELAASKNPVEMINQGRVFGRLSPQQKLDIISTLQRHGHFVAMLGDGVNDILSIKQADLGIAMGAGSTATKSVAGLVLLNNDFQLLPAAMDEARIVVYNLRRASKLFLVKNVYTIVLIVIAMGLLGLAFPYLPQQVTLLNLLTVGLPAAVIVCGRTVGEATNRTRFFQEIGAFVIPTGLVLGVAVTAMLVISAWVRSDSILLQRTLVLAVLIVFALQTVFRVVRSHLRLNSINDWLLLSLTALAVPAYLVVLNWPQAADFFRLEPMSLAAWGLVFAVVVPASLLLEMMDWRMRSISRRNPNEDQVT